jgi:hypothetical protein
VGGSLRASPQREGGGGSGGGTVHGDTGARPADRHGAQGASTTAARHVAASCVRAERPCGRAQPVAPLRPRLSRSQELACHLPLSGVRRRQPGGRMRGSATRPTPGVRQVDDKYGIPLHHHSMVVQSPVASHPRPQPPPAVHHMPRGPAPPFSPAVGPAAVWGLDEDSAGSLDLPARAPRDVYDGGRRLPEDPGPAARVAGSYHDRSPSPASARLSHAMPQDVVTSMALALGAPARPTRSDGAARRTAAMRLDQDLELNADDDMCTMGYAARC